MRTTGSWNSRAPAGARGLWIAAFLLASSAAGRSQEEAAPDPGAQWKFDFRLTLEEKDGEYVFVVAGTTDVPSAAMLRARVYAVEVVEDFRRGRREDEEPLVWEGDEEAGQPAFRHFQAAGGEFRVEVYRFRRKPWSIFYRGRIHYLPKLQDDPDVLRRMGDEEFSRSADLRLGTPESYAAELVDRVKEVTDDLMAIDVLFKDLRETFEGQAKKADLEAWKAWKDPWYARVERIAERNRERYGMWAVWMERQAKMRVGGMCDLLRSILVVCTEGLEGDAEAVERARKRMDGFHTYFEEAIEVIGINAPLDLGKVGPAMEAYEEGIAPLRKWAESRDGDGEEPAREAFRRCSAALLRITPHLRTRRRAYQYLNEIAVRLARLVGHVRGKADAGAIRTALEEHDAAVRDFKTFAGMR